MTITALPGSWSSVCGERNRSSALGKELESPGNWLSALERDKSGGYNKFAPLEAELGVCAPPSASDDAKGVALLQVIVRRSGNVERNYDSLEYSCHIKVFRMLGCVKRP